MFPLHTFLRSALLFVKTLAVKGSEQMRRTTPLLAAGMITIAVILSVCGLGGSQEAVAATIPEARHKVQSERSREGRSFITEAKIQSGFLYTGSKSRQLAGNLLEQNVRREQDRQAKAQAETEALQKQIIKERQEEEARKKAEEERKAARRIKITEEEYQILLRIVQAEAGICDEKGKILVADVIINRVLSREFPNSVKAVVYQPSQFQPVSNGSIDSVKVSSETIACVDRALAGEDYSNGALYFMNRKGSGSEASWFDRRLTYLFSHDGHEFFR